MGLLLDRWRLAQSGEGQIVTLIGEAGIGKSRAVEALQEALAGEPHRRIHLQCSPYYSDSSLFPVIKQLSRAAGFAADDSPGARIDKLRALFARRAASGPAGDSAAGGSFVDCGPEPRGARVAQSGTTQGGNHCAIGRRDRRLRRHRPGASDRGRRPLDRRHHARIDDAPDRQYRAGQIAGAGDGAAGFRAAVANAAAFDAIDARAPRPRGMRQSWSPASPPRTASPRRPLPRSSPRPTACRCSSKS